MEFAGCLCQETRLFSGSNHRTVESKQGFARSSIFDCGIQSVGAALLFPNKQASTDAVSGVTWQIDNGSGGELRLTEFNSNEGPKGESVSIKFGCQLFPAIALLPSEKDTSSVLVGLLSTGLLFFLTVDHDAHASGLEDQAADPQILDVSPQLTNLGKPTCLSTTGDSVIIGGASGTLLVLPSVPLQSYELRESSWGLKAVINTVWQRNQAPAVVSCMPVSSPSQQQEQDILLVAYDDGTLRGFSLTRRVQILAEHLDNLFTQSPREPLSSMQPSNGTPAARPAPKRNVSSASGLCLTFASAFAVPAAPGFECGSVILVSHFESRESATHHSAVYRLSHMPGSRGRLVIKESHELLGMEPAAAVTDARLDPADSNCLWLLCKSLGMSHEGQAPHAASSIQGGRPNDSMAMDLWEGLATSPAGSCSVALAAQDQALANIAVPGLMCATSLRDALAFHGVQVSLAEVETAGLVELQNMIRNSVQSLRLRNQNGYASSWVWAQLMASYQEAWSRRHPVLSIINHSTPASSTTSPAAGWVGCVRGGGMLSALRPATLVEGLGCSLLPSGGPDMSAVIAKLPHGVRDLHRWLKKASSLLGPLCLDSFVQLTKQGVDAAGELIPRLTSLWLYGPIPNPARAVDDITRDQHTQWRRSRQLLLLELTQILGDARDPIALLKECCGCITMLETQSVVQEPELQPTKTTLPSPAVTFLVCATRQVAYAQCSVTRDLLLLLGIVQHLRSTGGLSLNGAALNAEVAELVPTLHTQLQRSAIVYWLGATLATEQADEAPAVDPAALALSHLRLGSSPGDTEKLPGRRSLSTLPYNWQLDSKSTLLARLMPHVLKHISEGDALQLHEQDKTAVKLLLALEFGNSSSSSSASCIASRVMEIGYHLFLRREFEPLHALTLLAGASGMKEAGPEFLRGLGLTCQLAESYSYGHAREEAVNEAAACFFRAASSLTKGPSIMVFLHILCGLCQHLAGLPQPPYASKHHGLPPHPVRPVSASNRPPAAPECVGPSSKVFLHILCGLRQHLTGLPQPPYDEALLLPAACGDTCVGQGLLVLHYYETVMMLYEREGAAEGAIMFARAALQQLPHGVDLQADQERLALEGRLWANIFSYCCEAEKYEEAYTAVSANPVSEGALECLRRLIHELSERGALLTLCSLPLGGTVTITSSNRIDQDQDRDHPIIKPYRPRPGPRPSHHPTVSTKTRTATIPSSNRIDQDQPAVGRVSLLEEAVRTLQRRARNSDLGTVPQPYYVLHDFLSSRSDLAGAACALVAYARRLRDEGKPDKKTVAEVLTAYESAINELSLLDESEAWIDLTDPWFKQYGSMHWGTSSLFPTGSGREEPSISSQEQGSWQCAEPVLTLAQLKQEYQLVRCAALCAQRKPGTNPLFQCPKPEEVFSQLLHASLYDDCILLASECWSGERLTTALERALVELRSSCISAMSLDIAERDTLYGSSQLGSSAAPLWQRLQQLLTHYEAEVASTSSSAPSEGLRNHGQCLRLAVADGILRADRRMQLPPWLLQLFGVCPIVLSQPGVGSGPAGGAVDVSGGIGPSELLGVYLAHDRWADAVAVACELLQAWERVDPRSRKLHRSFWMPVQQLSVLRARLASDLERSQSDDERASTQGLSRRLEGAIQDHLDLAACDSGKDSGVGTGDTLMLGAPPAASMWGRQAAPSSFLSDILQA
eukprot:gene3499-13566_t